MRILLPLALILTVVLGYLAYRQRAHLGTSLAASERPAAAPKQAKPQAQAALEVLPSAPAADSEPATKRPPGGRTERHDLTAVAPTLSHAELARRAAKVEQEANHELARLVKLLDLTDDQQDKIFATLAQNSPDYHPTMGLAAANHQPLVFIPFGSAAGTNGLNISGKGSPSGTQNLATGGSSVSYDGIWTGTLGIANLVREDVQGSNNLVASPTTNNGNAISNGATDPTIAPPLSGTNTVTDALTKTTTSIEELVAPYLTGPQQNALSEEESDRVAWWAELTTELASGLETPAVDGPTAAPETIIQVYDDAL